MDARLKIEFVLAIQFASVIADRMPLNEFAAVGPAAQTSRSLPPASVYTPLY
jgi:hypothetical protein